MKRGPFTVETKTIRSSDADVVDALDQLAKDTSTDASIERMATYAAAVLADHGIVEWRNHLKEWRDRILDPDAHQAISVMFYADIYHRSDADHRTWAALHLGVAFGDLRAIRLWVNREASVLEANAGRKAEMRARRKFLADYIKHHGLPPDRGQFGKRNRAREDYRKQFIAWSGYPCSADTFNRDIEAVLRER